MLVFLRWLRDLLKPCPGFFSRGFSEYYAANRSFIFRGFIMGVFHMHLFNGLGGRRRGRARLVLFLNPSSVAAIDHSCVISSRDWGQVLDELVDSVVEPIHHHVSELVEVFL